MHVNKSPLRLAFVASSALLLTSCGGRINLADLPAPLEVDQPTVCEDVLIAPTIPPARPEDDAIGAFLENRAVAIVAVATIKAGRECIRDQRQDYAGKGSN